MRLAGLATADRVSPLAGALAPLSPFRALGWLSAHGRHVWSRAGTGDGAGTRLRLVTAGGRRLAAGVPARPGLPDASSTWGQVEEVPGTGALNAGGQAEVTAMSCAPSAGCEAGGVFATSSQAVLPFVDSQAGGSWGKATVLTDAAKFSPGGEMGLLSMSCPSAGNCSAGGVYDSESSSTSETGQAFVVSESGGDWHDPVGVAGALNAGDDAEVSQVSCASAGNCAAVGYYSDSSGNVQPFVVSESGGKWHAAQQVLGAGDAGAVITVSCASPGYCTAAGQYGQNSTLEAQAFAVSEVNGAWKSAELIPGSETLTAGGSAQINSVSCASAGNCAAVGNYADASGTIQALAATESGGNWDTAFPLPGAGALNTSGQATGTVISCPSAGNCGVGGAYDTVFSSSTGLPESGQAFVASIAAGHWKGAREMPGSAEVNPQGVALIDAMSCPSGGNCAAGGLSGFTGTSAEAFVISDVTGDWNPAEIVPGLSGAKSAIDAVAAVSCAAAGHCSAGGGYTDGSGKGQAFVVGERAAGCSAGVRAGTVTAGTAAAQCYPVGIYSNFSGKSATANLRAALNKGWPSIANVSGLSQPGKTSAKVACTEPWTRGTGSDKAVEAELGVGPVKASWAVSYWTAAAPPPGANLKADGEKAGRAAGAEVQSAYKAERDHGGRGILPDVVALDPEGLPCPYAPDKATGIINGRGWSRTWGTWEVKNGKAVPYTVAHVMTPGAWKAFATGWATGVGEEGLTPAIYVNSSQYKTDDVGSFRIDIIMAASASCPVNSRVCPIPAKPPVPVTDQPRIVGYAAYYGPVTSAGVCDVPATNADLATIASWGAPHSTLQFGYKTKTTEIGISKICPR